MKSTELLLIHAILTDVSIALHTSIDRDWSLIQSRFKHEGLSFLTITLPTFAKDFERCLEQGYVSTAEFRPFKKVRGSELIPAFLQGITTHVFDECGVVRQDASPEAIDGIRQVCLALHKLKMECTDDRKAKAIQSYLSCERDLRSFRPCLWAANGTFRTTSRLLFGRVFAELEQMLQRGDINPKHGPGSVFESLTSNGKYRWKRWNKRLDRYFPLGDYLYVNHEDALQRGGNCVLRNSEDDNVKVIFVPKTLKTPRVIAIEPTYNQYTQQGLLAPLVELVEKDPLTRGSVLFSDSTVNGRLARESSITRKLATLDLSEASDRVHAGLAYQLFRDYPYLARAIFACRTKYALLPDGTRVPLVKFASMGSALCFPVEALVFYTMSVMNALAVRKLRPTYRNILLVKRDIAVFGDDIIIPVSEVSGLVDLLHSAGLKVNTRKTFVNGYFRESCGVDAYQGVLVTPVYVRQTAPTSTREAEKITSYVATANLFYRKGYWNTARFMRLFLDGLLGPLPHVGRESTLLGYTSVLNCYTTQRWNGKLHRYESFGYVQRTRRRKDKLHEYDRLLKFFLSRKLMPSESKDFDSSVIRGSLTLTKRWATPY
jgi:hypothetical protein